jgi:hypothetical protein
MGEYEFDDRDTQLVIAEKCRTQLPATARALPQTSALPTFPAGPASTDFRANMQPVIDQGVN